MSQEEFWNNKILFSLHVFLACDKLYHIFALLQTGTYNKKKEESEMGMKTLRNSTWLLISSIYSQHYIFYKITLGSF
jgi:hypothetical protein